ncbi:MAG: cytochrome c oxidase subunit 3 [Cryomorphaceae bacterium]|nr:cytochrome c oxidase subunit 3 [Cryomorphaceae bacterium]
MTTTENTLIEQRKRAKKPLLWVSMASIFMAFAGLTSGYVVSKGSLEDKGLWMTFSLPNEFLTSTLIIIFSSALLIAAGFALKKGDMIVFKASIGLALAFGLAFMVFQILGWEDLVKREIFFTGPKSNVSGSWIYAITFFHLLHVIGGITALIVTFVKALMGLYSEKNKLGFELTSIFWHFLGAVWLYLYLFLIFLR